METVLITGGTGLIGTRLTQLLQQKKYNVAHLSRNKKNENSIITYAWNIKKGFLEEQAITSANYIIHLAGAGIADQPWTTERKKEIINSRVESANLLFEKIKTLRPPLKAFISASAIGYYGVVTSGNIFTENDPPASDFLGKTCQLWEEAADRIGNLETHLPGIRIRTVKIRTGMVLSNKGGALPKMANPVRNFIGAPLGTGKQYIPWIHIDDLCRIYIKAIEDVKMQGAYNGVAPQSITNRDFTKAIARTLNKPLILPNVPQWILKIILGEMAVMVLEGSRVSCEKIMMEGFSHEFPELDVALKELLKK